jgi:hypothetical protein
MGNNYTENLAEFGSREIRMLSELLNAWMAQGLPDGFFNAGVKPAMNKMSGNVFLTNEEYQIAMMNGDKLESFYSLPYGGEEGFLCDLIDENSPADLHHEDVDYILNLAEAAAYDLPQLWLALHVDRIISDA